VFDVLILITFVLWSEINSFIYSLIFYASAPPITSKLRYNIRGVSAIHA